MSYPEPDDYPPGEIVVEFYLHIIFWTRQLRPALSADMLAGACAALDQAMFAVDGEVLAAGGTENHLHILARLSQNYTAQAALDALRAALTAWPANGRKRAKVAWSDSEVAVTIGLEDIATAKKFIEDQASHHAIVSFEQELKAIFDEHDFDYDERELWG
jgi:REP element-mobilizing transposase RayT